MKVTKAQLGGLRKALLRERFFELAGSYGEPVVDGGTTTIQVTAGQFTKTVDLQFLGNWFVKEPGKYREPSRAVHVLDVVYGWCDEASINPAIPVKMGKPKIAGGRSR